MGYDFDGTDDTISVADTTFDFERTASFSAYAWINVDTLAADAALISKLDNAAPNSGWELQLIAATSKLRVNLVNNYGLPNRIVVDSTNTISTGAWTHVGF